MYKIYHKFTCVRIESTQVSFLFKRIISINLIIIILFSFYTAILADDIIENVDEKDINTVIETAAEVSKTPKIDSRYAVVIDRQSKTILYGKNETSKTILKGCKYKILFCTKNYWRNKRGFYNYL